MLCAVTHAHPCFITPENSAGLSPSLLSFPHFSKKLVSATAERVGCGGNSSNPPLDTVPFYMVRKSTGGSDEPHPLAHEHADQNRAQLLRKILQGWVFHFFLKGGAMFTVGNLALQCSAVGRGIDYWRTCRRAMTSRASACNYIFRRRLWAAATEQELNEAS